MKEYIKTTMSLLVIVITMILAGCDTASPDAGEETVLIDKPLFFGHGGVQQEPVKTGLTWIFWTTEEVEVNVQPQQFDIVFEDLMSSDGIPLDFKASIRLQVVDTVLLITKFGENWYNNNVEREYENLVRKAVKKYTMTQTAIESKGIDGGLSASELIDEEVAENLTKYVTSIGLPVKLISSNVGRANPPDAVKTQRIETAQQEQRRVTESKKEAAEVVRKKAEIARADADNAYRNNMNLSPEQFVELERIKMLNDVCVTNKAGCTFLIGTNTTPVVNLK